MAVQISGAQPRLHTDRFVLRPLRTEDAPALYDQMSDPEVVRYLAVEPFVDPTQALRFIDHFNVAYREGSAVRWGITRWDGGALVGTIGYHRWLRNHFRAEVGYVLGRPHWRQGVISEVLPAVVDFGFNRMGLNRIEAVVIPANGASQRVLEKVGFLREAHLEEYLVSDGQITDAEMWRLLRREYSVRPEELSK